MADFDQANRDADENLQNADEDINRDDTGQYTDDDQLSDADRDDSRM